jgi:hypothetical protein
MHRRRSSRFLGTDSAISNTITFICMLIKTSISKKMSRIDQVLSHTKRLYYNTNVWLREHLRTQRALELFAASVVHCKSHNDCVKMAFRPSETTNLLNNVRSDDIERGPSNSEEVDKRQSRPDGE